MEDEQIVEMYLCRNEAALKNTAEKYGARLRNLANNILEDMTSAEECENDTYMEAWNSIPPHEPRTYLFPFLARITRHISLDYCRKRSRIKRKSFLTELTEEMEQCIPAPNDTECQLDGLILGSAISTFLRRIPEERRNAFLRRYWYLDSIAAISKRFALSESKVKSMLFRCRNELREYLIKEGYTL